MVVFAVAAAVVVVVVVDVVVIVSRLVGAWLLVDRFKAYSVLACPPANSMK